MAEAPAPAIGIAEDDLVPISALQHFLYCSRQCALIHVEQQWAENRFTAEGRLLHKDWNLYDTAHVVFQPKGMSVEQLEEGYEQCYRRIFSHASIWRRRN